MTMEQRGQLLPVPEGRTFELHGHTHSERGVDPVVVWPVGMIGLWSKTDEELPHGFYVCDGTKGTPDLRDKFIVGAGSTYAPADTGGSATQANHTGHGAHGDHDNHATELVAASGAGENIAVTPIAHSAHTNNGAISAHGTNLPPYYALYYVIRMH